MCGVRGGSRRHAREFPASCPAPTGHLLAASTQNRPPVHSACQRGSKNGQNRKKPCRVDAKSASCAFCLSTRQQKRAKSPKTLPRRRKIGLLCILRVNAANAGKGKTPSGGTPVASLPPAPPTIYCVPASRELVSCGPLPLPLSGGGQAPRREFPPSRLRPPAATASPGSV